MTNIYVVRESRVKGVQTDKIAEYEGDIANGIVTLKDGSCFSDKGPTAKWFNDFEEARSYMLDKSKRRIEFIRKTLGEHIDNHAWIRDIQASQIKSH